jgi:hypothetical protein
MWLFRRNPQGLTAQERNLLETLFKHIPRLRKLHALRVRFKTIFDTMNKREASLALTQLCLDALDGFPDLEQFVCTYEKWQMLILNYFPEGRTSAAVEGINNKARVIQAGLRAQIGRQFMDALDPGREPGQGNDCPHDRWPARIGERLPGLFFHGLQLKTEEPKNRHVKKSPRDRISVGHCQENCGQAALRVGNSTPRSM